MASTYIENLSATSYAHHVPSFLVYIHDLLFLSVQFSYILSFADDIIKLIHDDQDIQQIQQDLESLPSCLTTGTFPLTLTNLCIC